MNVSGLASITPCVERSRAMRASVGADSNTRPRRRASSSMTSKPTLCRVPRYFDPGFPSPTISFTSFFFFCLDRFRLTLLDDFRLGRSLRRHGRSGRRLLGDFCLWRDHVHDHRLGLAERLPRDLV